MSFNNPNYFLKGRNISRSFATDQNFNLAFSRFVYGLGKNVTGEKHFSYNSVISSTEAYPVAFTPIINVRYEIDFVFQANLPEQSWILFHVEEYLPNGESPRVKYLSSFKVPKDFSLEKIKNFGVFFKPGLEDGDEIRIEDGFGDSLFVISRQGLDKLGSEPA